MCAYTFFVWVELIGFDNAKPDYGVGDYLDRMAVKPQAISLLLDNDGLFLSHKEGLPADFAFPPNVAAYGGRPTGGGRSTANGGGRPGRRSSSRVWSPN